MTTTKKPAKKTPTKEQPKVEAAPVKSGFAHDARVLALHPIGAHIEKRSKDGRLVARITVAADGFTWHGRTYGALSPIASEIAGSQRNGLVYFGIIPLARGTRTAEELAPEFDRAVETYNAAHRDGMKIAIGLKGLLASEHAPAVRSAVATLRNWRARLKAELKALEEGEQMLEVQHGRVQDAEAAAA